MSAEFFKSTFSGGDGTCVEVSHRAEGVLIRDSKYTGPSHDQPTLAITAELWPAFLDLVLSGDSGPIGDQLSVEVLADGSATLINPQGVTLDYNPAEWSAFTKGVVNAEFNR
ncbi:DUF397 domain-containing protein [Nocardia niigatensis]|uniref:DUF397 domain-containing protein n=1 Tax=Nocardia niigatensis TaxID=209249 RepID=UPI0002E13C4E|nr:DUF397 domain-containing protein [Nocardia niigatensis]